MNKRRYKIKGENMKSRVVILAIMVLSSIAYSDFTTDGEVRLRYEVFDNVNEKYYGANPKVAEGSDSYLLTRVRLGFTYDFTEYLTLRASLQDSRVFGWGFANSDWYNKEFNMINNPQQDNTELYETYLRYHYDGLEITAGRQKITYGDKRVFGPGEWKNAGKWVWDAVKVSYKKDGNFLDIFYGGNVIHDPDQFSLSHRHAYKGAGLYGHYAFSDTGAFEPILAYKHNDEPNTIYNELIGYYGGFRVYDENIYNFFYDATYIKSMGKYTKVDGSTVDIDAQGYHIEGGYKLKAQKLKIGAGYTYASGDNPNTSIKEGFDSVFGASDKYYGRMNLFSWSNLKDYELFAIYKGIPKTNIKFEYHKFYADQPTNKWKSYTIKDMKNNEYGDELDIVATYSYSKDIKLSLGLSYFLAGDYISEASTKDKYITDDNSYGIFTEFQFKF